MRFRLFSNFIAISCQKKKQGLLAGDEQGNEGREGDNEDGGGNREGGAALDVAVDDGGSGSADEGVEVAATLDVVAVSLALEGVAGVRAGLATLDAVGEGVDIGGSAGSEGSGS